VVRKDFKPRSIPIAGFVEGERRTSGNSQEKTTYQWPALSVKATVLARATLSDEPPAALLDP